MSKLIPKKKNAKDSFDKIIIIICCGSFVLCALLIVLGGIRLSNQVNCNSLYNKEVIEILGSDLNDEDKTVKIELLKEYYKSKHGVVVD